MNLNLSIPTKLSRGALAALLCLLVALAGGVYLYWIFHTEPTRPGVYKWRVSHYLKKQTGLSHFQIDFKFPSQAEMNFVPPSAKAKSGASAGADLPPKDFDTVKREYVELQTAAMAFRREATELRKALDQRRARLATVEKAATDAGTNAPTTADETPVLRAQVAVLEKELATKESAAETKEQAVRPVLEELAAFRKAWAVEHPADEPAGSGNLASAQAELSKDLRQKFEDATTYEAMYRLIGEELWVADRLFGSANPEHQQVALRLAQQAGRDALYQTENAWLAGSIYKGYVCPSIGLASSGGTADIVLNDCADFLRRCGDNGAVINLYQEVLATTKTPKRADWARVQISQIHEQAGEFKEAVHWLQQVKATNDYRWAMQRIPRLEQRISRGR